MPKSKLLKTFDRDIGLLTKYYNSPVEEIERDGELRSCLDRIRQTGTIFHGTEFYKQLMKAVRTNLENLQSSSSEVDTKLRPGTVGAFLFGCVQGSKEDLDTILESPLCIGSLPPEQTTPITTKRIFNLDESGRFQALNVSNSDQGLIFIERCNVEISEAEQQQLRELGLTKVTLFRGHNRLGQIDLAPGQPEELDVNGDGVVDQADDVAVAEDVNGDGVIDQADLAAEPTTRPAARAVARRAIRRNGGRRTSRGNGLFWVIAILAIIAIIGLGYYFWRCRRDQTDRGIGLF